MLLFDWFWGILGYLGLYQKTARILLLGLDNAGKTTLLYLLKDGRLQSCAPTIHPNMEELKLDNITLLAHDLGGHEQARKLWADYYMQADALVFLVDATDTTRFVDAKKELDILLTCDELAPIPVLVLGNKVDVPGAASEATLREGLGLQYTSGKIIGLVGFRPIELFMCSLARRQGFGEGFRWLAGRLK